MASQYLCASWLNDEQSREKILPDGLKADESDVAGGSQCARALIDSRSEVQDISETNALYWPTSSVPEGNIEGKQGLICKTTTR